MMILCGLLPLLLSGIQAIEDVEVCSNQPADIGFLIDESGSVSQTNFKINLDMVKKFVNDFEIGNNAMKISVFAFHQLIGDGFYFSCCHSKASIKSEIDNINFASGSEDFEMALTFAKRDMFQSVNGARSCTLKILMLFTDGQSPIKNASSLLHQLGVLVYAIGVGSGVNKDTLNKIATNESYVLMMPSYSDLLGEGYSNITSQICIDVLTNPCERIPKPCKNTKTCVWTGGSRYMCLGINGSTDNNCTKGLVYHQQNR
ncbi:von Willebrand factor A domain-containing protein 2-like [Mytilus edulis]|uniref:von Willebrand factor A domain-containing protein 2-like n=1 Tax=Mytilus edulis TaxID=6550 RepID=UPI0039EFCA9A